MIKKNTPYYLIFFLFSICFVIRNYKFVDILGSDEVVYLNSSSHIQLPFQNNYIGAIYSLWYAVINYFTNDPIHTYYFNYFFLSVVPVFFLLILLINIGYNKTLSLIITLLFLFSQFNLYLLPKITNLSVILVIIGLLLIKKNKTILGKLFVTGIITLIISYIRPEYYIAFLLSFLSIVILFGIKIIKKEKLLTNDSYKLLILLITASSFYLLFGGTPLSNRSFDAFVQHYVRNYCEKYNILHPFTLTEEFKLFREVFNTKSQSLFAAAFDEPAKFFWHCSTNIKKSIIKLPSIIYDIIFEGIFSAMPSIINFLKFLIALFAIFGINWKKTLLKLKFSRPFHVFLSIFLLFFPVFVGLIIVYPRDHYLVVVLVLVFIAMSEIIDKIVLRDLGIINLNTIKNYLFQAFFFFCFIFSLLMHQELKTKFNVMYQMGRDISKKTNLTLIDDYFAKIYFGNRIKYINPSEYDGKTTFIVFINKHHINFIHVNSGHGLRMLLMDKNFEDFQTNFQKYDFIKINLGETNDNFFIKKQLYATFSLENYK
jgi:hypothetical protein